ncbi:MAG: HEAT repeat domain-containing protein [Halobacteriales archaeon]
MAETNDEGPADLIERVREEPGSATEEDLDRLVGLIADLDPTEMAGPDPYLELSNALMAAVGEDPDRIDRVLEDVEEYLESPDPEVRADAAQVALDFAQHHPRRTAATLLGALAARFDDDSIGARNTSVRAVGRLVQSTPEVLTPDLVERLPALFEAEIPEIRLIGTMMASEAAEQYPDLVAGMVPALAERIVVEDPGDEAEIGAGGSHGRSGRPIEQRRTEGAREGAMEIRQIAARSAEAIVALAGEEPGAVAEHAPEVVEALEAEDAADPYVRNQLLDALGAVARSHPESVVAGVDALVEELVSADEAETAGRAAWALGFVAEGEERTVADAVEPAVPAVIGLLDADNARVRGAAASLLMYVGEHHPDAVEPAAEPVRALLSDDQPFVRGSAAWVLGLVGDEGDRDRLSELAEEDPDAEVRRTAGRALESLGE